MQKPAIWLALLISINVSLLAAIAVYDLFAGVSSIGTFSSGALTLVGIADKTRDYAAMLAFVTVALLVFCAIYELLQCLSNRMSEGLVTSVGRAVILANIPTFYVFGQMIFSQKLSKELLSYSIAAELVVCLCAVAFQLRRQFDPSLDPKEPISSGLLDWVLPVLLFSVVAGAATPLSISLVSAIDTRMPDHSASLVEISRVGELIALFVAAFACVAVCSLGREKIVQRGGYLILAASQIFLLAGAVRLYGPVIFINDLLQHAARLTTIGECIIIVVVLGSMISVMLSAWHVLRSPRIEDWMRRGYTMTPMAVALLVFFIKIAFDTPAGNLADEYHTGEFAVPYWAYKTYGLLPYVDIAPARGLVNLVHGWFAEEILGGKYTAYAYAGAYVAVLIFFIQFLALRWVIGPWPALLLTFLSTAANGVSEIDVFNTALLAVICRASLIFRPVTWLAIWVLLGTIAVLFAPGQGALLVLATGPLGLIKFYKSLTKHRSHLVYLVAAIFAIAAALAIATPFMQIILGAVQYVLEQSRANTEANGIPWILGFGHAPVSNQIFWEILRSFWLVITIGIGALVYLEFRKSNVHWSVNRRLTMGTAIFILGTLFIFRAAVRIDPGSWTRLGLATDWFVLLLAPLYIFFTNRQRVGGWTVGAIMFAAGLINSISPWAQAINNLQRPVLIPVVSSNSFLDGANVGLEHLGRGQIDRARFENYISLKHFVDSEISPEDTFIDLTNRSSLYYLLGRRPPIEATVYNLTNENEQARVVGKLVLRPPGYALAAPSNSSLVDGGSLSLRAHLLYRFMVENYRPLERDNAIWLKHIVQSPGPGSNSGPFLNQADLSLMTRAFAQKDLGALPRVWGESWSELRHQISNSRPINLDKIILHDIERSSSGGMIPIGKNPYFEIELNKLNIDGAKAGILAMEFACIDTSKLPTLKVSWTNALVPEQSEQHAVMFQVVNGGVIVPLDSAPSWILGGRINSIRISFLDGLACKEWRFLKMDLAQRSSISLTLENNK